MNELLAWALTPVVEATARVRSWLVLHVKLVRSTRPDSAATQRRLHRILHVKRSRLCHGVEVMSAPQDFAQPHLATPADSALARPQ
jgi:hypothetical protein